MQPTLALKAKLMYQSEHEPDSRWDSDAAASWASDRR